MKKVRKGSHRDRRTPWELDQENRAILTENGAATQAANRAKNLQAERAQELIRYTAELQAKMLSWPLGSKYAFEEQWDRLLNGQELLVWPDGMPPCERRDLDYKLNRIKNLL